MLYLAVLQTGGEVFNYSDFDTSKYAGFTDGYSDELTEAFGEFGSSAAVRSDKKSENQ